MCLADGCYELVISSGSADSEISFEFVDEVRWTTPPLVLFFAVGLARTVMSRLSVTSLCLSPPPRPAPSLCFDI